MKVYNFNNFIQEKVKESPISNIKNYAHSLSKSIKDKLFFLSNIKDTDLIVDFGCADATLLSEIRKRKPQIRLIGYDISEEMLSIARQKYTNIKFTSNWNEITSVLKNYKKATLLLSSVIHEVYSYSSTIDIKIFWERVFNSGFEYIVIRDMIPSVGIQKQDFLNFREDVKKVNKYSDKKYLYSFERIWGLIDNDYRTMLHWLLKYRYTDNWEREVKENYLPLTLETLYKKIPLNYKIIYKHNYIFEPLQRNIMTDFRIKINHTTHTKMIIKKYK